MKYLRHLALLLLTGTSTLAHAQHSADNPLYRHLPADADKVYQINYSVLSGKLDWKSLIANMPPSQVEKRKELLSILSDPYLMGVDARQDIFVTETNTFNIDSPRYTTVLLPLTDSGKFIRFLKEQDKTANLVILPGKTRTAREGTTTGCAWNAGLAVITFVKAPMASTMGASHGTPGHANPPTGKAQPAVTGHHYALLAIHRSTAALKGFDNSPYQTDKLFREGFADDADLHTWSRYGSGIGMMMNALKATHAPMDHNLEETVNRMKKSGTRTLGTLRFDAGRITYQIRTINDSPLIADINTRPLNTGLLERLPQGNLLGIFTLHFDPMALAPLVEKVKAEKSGHSMDSALAAKGLTTKDIFSAFKGDLLVAVIAGNKPAKTDTAAAPSDTTHPALGKPVVYLIFTINDMDAFTRVNAALHLTKDSAASTTAQAPADTASGHSPFGKWHPAHRVRDNIFVFAPNQQAADDYFDKAGRGPSRLVTEEVRSNPVALALDVKSIAAFLQPALGQSAKDQQVLSILGLFDQMTFAGGKVQGKEMVSLLEIKMADQQRNSLQTLMQMLHSPK